MQHLLHFFIVVSDFFFFLLRLILLKWISIAFDQRALRWNWLWNFRSMTKRYTWTERVYYVGYAFSCELNQWISNAFLMPQLHRLAIFSLSSYEHCTMYMYQVSVDHMSLIFCAVQNKHKSAVTVHFVALLQRQNYKCRSSTETYVSSNWHHPKPNCWLNCIFFLCLFIYRYWKSGTNESLKTSRIMWWW